MALRLNGSTSGYVEIDAPATAGSNTLTLPTGNGTSGQVLSTNGSGALSWTQGGRILQVLSTGATGNLGAGTVDLVSVSITPSSASNKVLILAHTNCYTPAGTTSVVDLYRGATFVYRSAIAVGWGVYAHQGAATIVHLDSPATTSSVTYKIQGLHTSGATAPNWNYYDNANTANTSITVMEVQA